MKKIAIAISGASGVNLGLQLTLTLKKKAQVFVIASKNAKKVLQHEQKAAFEIFDKKDITAPTASGSFGLDALCIVPCSMNTLAKISCGVADNLITRTAYVILKERKTMLLAPRELPLHAIALENMLKLSRLDVIIAPPVVGFYANIKSLEDMQNFLVGKWCDALGIKNELYDRWKSTPNDSIKAQLCF